MVLLSTVQFSEGTFLKEFERDTSSKAQPRQSSARGRRPLSTVPLEADDSRRQDVEGNAHEQWTLSEQAMLEEAARETEALFASLGTPLQRQPSHAD